MDFGWSGGPPLQHPNPIASRCTASGALGSLSRVNSRRSVVLDLCSEHDAVGNLLAVEVLVLKRPEASLGHPLVCGERRLGRTVRSISSVLLFACLPTSSSSKISSNLMLSQESRRGTTSRPSRGARLFVWSTVDRLPSGVYRQATRGPRRSRWLVVRFCCSPACSRSR